ncbi:PREDICTED: troponin T, skeletal muscle-like isoform X2 [Camelina sativa]|uniref:Troponin T, skeletal muscle-like isoform X2 n=1 Tax=Camelina sativa TaxID=90675 RepID=A0ABM0W7J6_CAMSA|nr:PREDICTED: troponin T, skeletal muscle-like isoform X2 [Camelina sativa]
MGGCTSKKVSGKSMKSVKETSKEKNRGSRRPMVKERDEREKVMYAQLKEAEREWRKERKKLREEVRRLREKLEEREEAKTTTTTTTEEREYWKWVVEEMCVERAVRDEAVEKWKQLYLAIKNELDHLIIHTTSSSAIMQMKLGKEEKEEEETEAKTVEVLRDEVRVKEETIETLKEKISLMDRQKYEKEREIDILRQSLKILGSKKKKKKRTGSLASMNLLILKTKCVKCT